MKPIFFILLFVSTALQGAELKSAQSQKVAEQLIQVVNQKLAEIAALELAAGASTDDIEIELFQHARFDSGKFGAILSAEKVGQILSVTPRGQASLLGLQSGDVIKKVNNVSINEAGSSWAMHLQYMPNKTPLSLLVNRNGEDVLLQGTLKAKYIPQWQLLSAEKLAVSGKETYKHIPFWHLDVDQPIFVDESHSRIVSHDGSTDCGQIVLVNSLSMTPSRFTGLKDTATIKDVNGEPWGDKSRQRFPVGTHYMKIGSKYDTPKEIKNLSITIEANTNYYIAYVRKSPWVDEHGTEIDIGTYTGPVVWKTTNQSCVM